jgi:hypothetical protein
MTVAKMMTLILVTGCLLGFVILAERAMECPPPWRGMCMNKLKQIGLALHVLVSGPGTMFPGAESTRYEQVTDGSDNTLAAVEISNVQIPWTKPEDLDVRTMSLLINDPKRQSISSQHLKGANALFADASCRFLPESTTADRLRSLFTIAGGEPVTKD